MAEALSRHYWGVTLEVHSAGVHPLGFITPQTLEVLKERRVACEGLSSKGFSAVDFRRLSLVVSLTDSSLDGLLPGFFSGRLRSWYIRDPYGESIDSFRQACAAIDWLITDKLPRWLGWCTPGAVDRAPGDHGAAR
jgi:protein-tyrosine-phosphatase